MDLNMDSDLRRRTKVTGDQIGGSIDHRLSQEDSVNRLIGKEKKKREPDEGFSSKSSANSRRQLGQFKTEPKITVQKSASPQILKFSPSSRTTNHSVNLALGYRRLLSPILLPLLCMFLLPSLKQSPGVEKEDREQGQQAKQMASPVARYELTSATLSEGLALAASNLLAGDLLLGLLRLPVHTRLGWLEAAEAKEISSRQDLQEEETLGIGYGSPERHAHLMAPAAMGARNSLHSAGGQYNRNEAYGQPSGAAAATLDAAQLAPGESSVTGSGDYVTTDQADGGSQQPSGSATSVEGAELAGPPMQMQGGVASTSGGGLQTRGDLPAVRALNVKCEKNHMTVNIVFDRPFYGLVFSKGHYNDQKCVHLPANSGQTSVNFDIHLGKCGMSSSDASGNPANGLQLHNQQQQQQPNGLYIENTIIIQYDPQVQEIFDQARKLRCTWYDYYEKSVTFRPYNVDMLDAVTANFLGDNIQCWMQIQVGKGPWSSEVAGIVKIGQTMTMVLAIKDDENKFDMLVRNCVAHDGKHQPIQLVDEFGCVARPKIMGKFQRVRNFGSSATVVSYAHFQAFKFPDSMSVHFQCVIQVCRHECPEPVCQPNAGAGGQSELAGQATPTSTSGDYTASGTEIVSSKEPPSGYYALNNSSSHHAYRHQTGSHHGNSVNLKLDEGQGRVQVKLDTSIMAGGGQRALSNGGGPLPPHLLHAAATDQSGYMPAAGFYRPPQGTVGVATATGPPPRAGGQLQMLQTGGATNGRPPMLHHARANNQLAPSSGQRHAHFSSPFPQQSAAGGQRASIYTNRMGEQSEQQPESTIELGPHPLSLIARPRGLPAALQSSIQRQRRSVLTNGTTEQEAITGSGRGARHSPTSGQEESTAIRTQKSIQVVSPDDVAFSLAMESGGDLDQEDDRWLPAELVSGSFSGPQPVTTRRRQMDPSLNGSSICFSATRLVVAILVTVVALASGLVLVAYFVWRQRAAEAEVADKLADAYYEPEPSEQQAAANAHYGLVQGACAARQPEVVDYGNLLLRRQQVEMQQRNNYLARLYSQFVPANYWR